LYQPLKTISVFEDFDDHLGKALLNSELDLEVGTDRNVDPDMGEAIASSSLPLEHVAISYMINAEDFFQACMRDWTWQNLQSLALTSQLLQCTADHEKTCALLYSAGMTALQMPKLQTLVLWNGAKDNACAFIYCANKDQPTITWRGTWDLELSPGLVSKWQDVASKQQGAFYEFHLVDLKVYKQKIEGTIRCHGDAIYHLDLPVSVVSAQSLRQMRAEEGSKQYNR
jgi:hypothetical protein